eukprot:3131077-Pyramimonas_sp.AAC.1
MLIGCVEVPRKAFWHDSRSSRRSSQADPWRWHPENKVLACFKVFKRWSSNEAVPQMNLNRCKGPMKRELGGR